MTPRGGVSRPGLLRKLSRVKTDAIRVAASRPQALEMVTLRQRFFERDTMNPTNRTLIESYLRHYNDKNVEAMVELFSEDAGFESVSNTTGAIRTTGREELRQLARQSAEFFASRRQTPVQWVSDAEHVAVEIEYWCRLARDLPDGKKAGEEMRLRGASFFTIRDGHICRLVDYM